MTTTVFVNNSTRTDAAWFQTLNDLAYNTFAATDAVAVTAALARGALKTVCGLTGSAGTNTVTATATPTPAAYATGDSYVLIPAATNTGATTLNVSSLGAKNVFANGAACVGNELVISVPTLLVYDGTQFNVIGHVAATQAELETGTNALKFTTPARQQHHRSAAKAYATWDDAGVLNSISYGVTSITDTGTGQWTANLSITLSHADHTTIGACGDNGGRMVAIGTRAATTVQVTVRNVAATLADSGYQAIAIFGDI